MRKGVLSILPDLEIIKDGRMEQFGWGLFGRWGVAVKGVVFAV